MHYICGRLSVSGVRLNALQSFFFTSPSRLAIFIFPPARRLFGEFLNYEGRAQQIIGGLVINVVETLYVEKEQQKSVSD